MKNQEYIEYTYLHRKVVMYLANKYIKKDKEKILKQIQYHDMDKLFMYLFYDKKDVSAMHRKLSLHHENEIEKNYIDYIEMILDWESARYTKPDKPLNAYEILPILKEFEIDKPNLPMEKDVLEYANSLKNISMEDIEKELIDYIKQEMV